MRHISFIMDGNRRYAKQQGISEIDAYNNGASNFLNLAKYLAEVEQTPYISCWALAKENHLKRDLSGFSQALINNRFLDEIINSFKCHFIGDVENLKPNLKIEVDKYIEQNNQIKNFKYSSQIFIFMNYSGSDDIVLAAQKSQEKIINGINDFIANSYVANIPPIDLVIRTGGHNRLSNYASLLLFYAEIYFLPQMWNDFSITDLQKILYHYKQERICSYGA